MSVSLNEGNRNHDILLKTLIGEAVGESEDGLRAICWVIYYRVQADKIYWYDSNEGNNIAGVCLKQGQFECWNSGEKRQELDKLLQHPSSKAKMEVIKQWLPNVYSQTNPIGVADHYNNPDKEARPAWMDNVDRVGKIGNHVFYLTKKHFRVGFPY